MGGWWRRRWRGTGSGLDRRKWPLSLRPREHGGNTSPTTRVHARVTSRRQIPSACGTFVAANARACPRFPPRNLNGKEGVDGSSPSEGSILQEIPANRLVLLSRQAAQSTSLGGPDHVELAPPSAKFLQMGLLPGTTEHLPEKEGLGATGRQTASKRAANPDIRCRRWPHREDGTSPGDRSPEVD
jgi:hypothetical protein